MLIQGIICFSWGGGGVVVEPACLESRVSRVRPSLLGSGFKETNVFSSLTR